MIVEGRWENSVWQCHNILAETVLAGPVRGTGYVLIGKQIILRLYTSCTLKTTSQQKYPRKTFSTVWLNWIQSTYLSTGSKVVQPVLQNGKYTPLHYKLDYNMLLACF